MILLAALAFDLLLGEYPPRAHPVVWVGRLADLLLEAAPRSAPVAQFLFGLGLVLLSVALVAVPAWLVLVYFRGQGPGLYVLAGALLLKPSFALRALFREVERVREALAGGDLQEARSRLARIVSRDVATLSPPLIAAAAIESAAENFTDSFFAPLLCFLLFGPAGALAYRAVNTLDAMVGYRGRYEYLGKAAARLDDLLNLVPARLAALLLVLSAGPAGGSPARAWRVMWRDRALTESPNAGWTMSAASGALGVALEKQGAYRLGDGLPEPDERTVRRALHLVGAAAFLAVVLASAVEVLRYAPVAG